MLGDFTIYREGTMRFKISIHIKNFKVRDLRGWCLIVDMLFQAQQLGPVGKDAVYVLTSAKHSHNVVVCPGVYIVTYLWLRGAFGEMVSTYSDTLDLQLIRSTDN